MFQFYLFLILIVSYVLQIKLASSLVNCLTHAVLFSLYLI